MRTSITRTALLLSTLFLLFSSMNSYCEINSLATAINKAGRQRMLTQSMMKDYCMIGLDISKEEAIGRLNQSIALFDLQLNELKAYAPSDEIRNALRQVETLWSPLKPILLAPPSRDKIPALMQADDDLLAASHKIVLLFQDVSGTAQDHLVNISGRQRMLSQRLAKLYMLRAWGFDNPQVLSDMDKTRNEFKSALNELEHAPQNNPEVNAALTEARKQWNLFEHGLNRKEELIPLIVSMSSDKLVATMNEITGMYELISIRTLASKGT